jgi:hypothetical protein
MTVAPVTVTRTEKRCFIAASGSRIPATVSQPDSESPGPSRIMSNFNRLKTRTQRRLELTPRASSLEHRRRDPGRRNVPGPLAESMQTTQCCRTGLSVSLSHTLTDRDRDSHRVTPPGGQAARPRPFYSDRDSKSWTRPLRHGGHPGSKPGQ